MCNTVTRETCNNRKETVTKSRYLCLGIEPYAGDHSNVKKGTKRRTQYGGCNTVTLRNQIIRIDCQQK